MHLKNNGEKDMIKKAVVITVLTGIVLSLAACGAGKTEAAPETDASATASTEKTDAEPAAVRSDDPEEIPAGTASESSVTGAENAIEPLDLYITTEFRGRSSENYNCSATLYYDTYKLGDASAEKYPGLNSFLEELAVSKRASGDKIAEEIYGFMEQDSAYITDGYLNYYSKSNSVICRADSRILSIKEYIEADYGGAHGSYYCTGLNVDTANGTKLQLTDIIPDIEGLTEIVREKLFSSYSGVAFYNPEDPLQGVDFNDGGQVAWIMDYSGITLVFNPYVLAPYSEGLQTICIPFDECPGNVADKYTATPEKYVQQMYLGVPVIMDINGDGMNEYISVTAGSAVEDGSELYGCGYEYQTWNVWCGGDCVTLEDWCYSGDFYLVRSGGGYYIYIFEVSDNDYSTCTVVDLLKAENDSERGFNASLPAIENEYSSDGREYISRNTVRAFVNPRSFSLGSRLQVLGTISGIREYSVGEDGWPVAYTDYYTIRNDRVFKPNRSISCHAVDEAGNGKGSGELASGHFYVAMRTDGRTWVDLQEIDADKVREDEYAYMTSWTALVLSELDPERPVYRLEYDNSGYPVTVNGIDENLLFENMLMYAG